MIVIQEKKNEEARQKMAAVNKLREEIQVQFFSSLLEVGIISPVFFGLKWENFISFFIEVGNIVSPFFID